MVDPESDNGERDIDLGDIWLELQELKELRGISEYAFDKHHERLEEIRDGIRGLESTLGAVVIVLVAVAVIAALGVGRLFGWL